MVNPKQQAIELCNKFKGYGMENESISIVQVSLDCVEKIIEQWEIAYSYIKMSNIKIAVSDREYWQDVKIELKKCFNNVETTRRIYIL